MLPVAGWPPSTRRRPGTNALENGPKTPWRAPPGFAVNPERTLELPVMRPKVPASHTPIPKSPTKASPPPMNTRTRPRFLLLALCAVRPRASAACLDNGRDASSPTWSTGDSLARRVCSPRILNRSVGQGSFLVPLLLSYNQRCVTVLAESATTPVSRSKIQSPYSANLAVRWNKWGRSSCSQRALANIHSAEKPLPLTRLTAGWPVAQMRSAWVAALTSDQSSALPRDLPSLSIGRRVQVVVAKVRAITWACFGA